MPNLLSQLCFNLFWKPYLVAPGGVHGFLFFLLLYDKSCFVTVCQFVYTGSVLYLTLAVSPAVPVWGHRAAMWDFLAGWVVE